MSTATEKRLPYKVRDLSLADLGRKKIMLAEEQTSHSQSESSNPTGTEGIVNDGRWVATGDLVSARHNKKGDVAFADGHVDLHKWTDSRTFKMSDGQLFGMSAPRSPDLKYMQKGYAQVNDKD